LQTQKSSILHKCIHNYTKTLQNFAKQILQNDIKCCTPLRNSTQLSNTIQLFSRTIHNFTHLYTTLHNFAQLHTILRKYTTSNITSKHYTKLYNKKNFTQLWKAFTKRHTTLHNMTTLLQYFTTFYNRTRFCVYKNYIKTSQQYTKLYTNPQQCTNYTKLFQTPPNSTQTIIHKYTKLYTALQYSTKPHTT